MWSRLSQLLKPPQSDDQGQAQAVEILHVILLTLFGVFGVWAVFVNHPVTGIVTAGMSALFFGLWLIMRRGFIKPVTWCLLAILIGGISIIVYFNGSIRVPAVSGFVACIAVAGLTQSKRITIGTAVAISAILYVLYRLEIAGRLPPVYYQTTGFLQWLTYAGVMCITAILLILARGSTLKALSLAYRNAAALAKRNQELQTKIAELQQAEHALRENEERYRTLFELASDSILLVDTESRKVIDANPTVARQSGYEREELLSMTIDDLTAEPEQTGLEMHSKDDVLHIPRRLAYRKDGSIVQLELTGRFFDWQGKKVWLVAARDITERIRAEDALHVYQEHLEELVQERTAQLTSANRELESFSYSLAHDLRAPLRTIDGFSRALLEDQSDNLNSEMRFYLDNIISASENMSQLIDSLLSLYRLKLNEITLEQVDLSAMAAGILDEFQQHEPQRDVEIKIDDGMVVQADRRLMKIVLANLLGNAWKFSAVRPQACIEFGKQEGQPNAYFVRDNGAGFDANYASKLFGVFQRLHTDNEFPGTGIGLATVRRIINRHHGEVWAVGATDQGATFFFTLPSN